MPWYGALVLDKLYSAGEFLSAHEYPNLIRWAKQVEAERVAVRRGRMVNRVWGGADPRDEYKGIKPLKERHSREDWAK